MRCKVFSRDRYHTLPCSHRCCVQYVVYLSLLIVFPINSYILNVKYKYILGIIKQITTFSSLEGAYKFLSTVQLALLFSLYQLMQSLFSRKTLVINYGHRNPLKRLLRYLIFWCSNSTIMALILLLLSFFSLLTSKLEEDFLYMAYADIMAKVTFAALYVFSVLIKLRR